MTTEHDTPSACPDLETLAAFLDGRLEGRDRQSMIEHLDGCPDCFELAADALRSRGEAQPGQETEPLRFPPASPGDSRRRQRRWRWVAVAAALLVAVGLLPRWLPAPASPSRQLLEPWATGSAALAAARGAFDDSSPFLSFAGGSSLRDRSFLLGVKSVDLAAAVAAGDETLAQRAADEIGHLASPLSGSEAIEREAASAAASPARSARALGRLEDLLDQRASPPHLRLGRWVEAARLAALTGHGEHFAAGATWEALPELAPGDLDEGQTRRWSAALGLAQAARRGDDPPDLPALESELTDLIRLAAR